MLKKNEETVINIDDISSSGFAVGRVNGLAVFVDDAVPGDRLQAHIIKVKKNYAVGRITRIIKASPDRVEALCPVSSRCGGCSFMSMSYDAEKKFKLKMVRDALTRIGKIDVPVDEILALDDPLRYRNKGMYPVGYGKDFKTTVGFFAKRTHRIIDCRSCLLTPIEFENIINIISKWISEWGVTLYNEERHTGLLRHIYIRKGFSTGEIMVCLVINGELIPRADQLVERLVSANSGIKSIVLNINKAHTNVVLGEKCVTVFGSNHIEDELCGLRFRISPLSFFQVNPACCELLYGKVREYAALKKDETLLDLYCGAGTIGLTLAGGCKKLIGVEIIPAAVENAKENAMINGIENAEFFCADAQETAKTFKEKNFSPDCVILDPPRKGCSEETVGSVAAMKPKRIVYVSCDPATLARDLARFDSLGYHAEKATAVDMFPRTNHCECVVSISR